LGENWLMSHSPRHGFCVCFATEFLALLGQKKYADAEPLLLQSCAGMIECAAKIPAAGRMQLIQALERPGQLYDAWGMPEKAADWRKKLAAEKAKEEQ
jgi:hypothetical protein